MYGYKCAPPQYGINNTGLVPPEVCEIGQWDLCAILLPVPL